MPQKQPLDPLSVTLAGVDTEGLRGRLIALEGPDYAGRRTQLRLLTRRLQAGGRAVYSGSAPQRWGGELASPKSVALAALASLAGTLEHEWIPALRSGFTVLTDSYVFSLLARAIAHGEDREWLERAAGFALIPHAVYYLRAETAGLVNRALLSVGGLPPASQTLPGRDRHESFVLYQSRVIAALDNLEERFGFTRIDADRSIAAVQQTLQEHLQSLQTS